MTHDACRPQNLPQKVLILGSGGLKIGQAGEFDYSGSQAIKALQQENIRTVLVNPNIATVQTDGEMADTVYLQPLTLPVLTKIIAKEKPDAILLNVGGQTALNLGLELWEAGVLTEHNVRVLGTAVDVIKTTEDRELFKNKLAEIGVKTARSFSVHSVEEAVEVAEDIGYPLMLRAGYSLGGLGSGRIASAIQLKQRSQEVLSASPQILIEEYLEGWKEVEYEIVRDGANNAVTVCNMENMDPMGIHTGESLVVAPSQTLSDHDYHYLREVSLRTARHLGIIGECNIQFALNPTNGDYRVIEVNARLSRSSALASKATGYPLAFVATKLALGYTLDNVTNSVTGRTTAFFEPALDYCVVKIPRWDTHKLKTADRRIGSEMKSVGEVMGIGRSFPEALQKAIRMVHAVSDGISDPCHGVDSVAAEIADATDRRLYALYQHLRDGGSVAKAQELSRIDPWFLYNLADIVKVERRLEKEPLNAELLRDAKRLGVSDAAIGRILGLEADEVRQRRLADGVCPSVKQIDTLAGEFDAQTNYLYLTYHGTEHDISSAGEQPIVVLGSGPYSIGSSVEFDWCAVNTARTLRRHGRQVVMINSNPETVSTDYDESARLYFEELTLERVRDIADFEDPQGIVVGVGGQLANNLVMPLHRCGYPIMGTPPGMIDTAENRRHFSALLGELGVDQPAWQEVTSLENARDFAGEVGYPILVRPSYVLSGAAMNVIWSDDELEKYLKEAAVVSRDHPVVMSDFICDARELEIDGVADHGEVVIYAISEHVENAGVHSGDATIVLPPQRLYLETIRRCKRIMRSIAKALNITGPFNLQFLAKDNAIKVIECNVRASRSFPFVSKVTNHNFIAVATEVMIGQHQSCDYETLDLDYVAVKAPQFSYNRLKGSDPVAQVEMASTGEVACLGDSYLEAFFLACMAKELAVRGKRMLVSIAGDYRVKLLEQIRTLDEQGWELFATDNTHDYLARHGVGSAFRYKAYDNREPSVCSLIANREVDLIITIPTNQWTRANTDGYRLRRLAIDNHIPLITNLQIAQLYLTCLCRLDSDAIAIRPWNEYITSGVLYDDFAAPDRGIFAGRA